MIQAAKHELNSLSATSESQSKRHMIDHPDEPIISIFYKQFIKSTWYSTITVKMASSKDGDASLYNVNDAFDFLMYTYMRDVTPWVRVKKKYHKRVRVCWCHNMGTNYIKNASFVVDDVTYHSWDSVWADIYYQFFESPGAGKRESHNLGNGNVSYMENFSEYLPEYPINIRQPWFYSMDTANSFPIFYKASQTRATHIYHFREKYTELLRMEYKNKNKEWVPSDKYTKYLNIKKVNITTPELYGRYAYVTDNEKLRLKCEDRTMCIKNVVSQSTQNPNKFGQISGVDLSTSDPCLAIFWVAENVTASAINNRSNYTTNTNNMYNGWDPIKHSTFSYDPQAKRIDKMSSDHFSITEPLHHLPSCPNEVGYHALCYCEDSAIYHSSVGPILSGNLKLTANCQIDNGDLLRNELSEKDCENSEDDDDDIISDDDDNNDIQNSNSKSGMFGSKKYKSKQESPEFITHFKMLTIRELRIHKNDKGIFNFDLLE